MDIIWNIALIVGIVIAVLAVLFVFAFVIGGMRSRSIQRGYVFRVAGNVEAKAALDRANGNY